MTLTLLGTLDAAVCYKMTTIFQTMSTQRANSSKTHSTRLIRRMVHSNPFMLSTELDVIGTTLSFATLRNLPLFMMQATITSSLAITTMVTTHVFSTRLMPVEWAKINTVAVGLTLLALRSGSEKTTKTSLPVRADLLISVLIIGTLSLFAEHLEASATTGVLDALANTEYNLTSTNMQIINDLSFPTILWNPTTITTAANATISIVLITTTLQHESITTANGAMTMAETFLPTALGLIMLKDHPRHDNAIATALRFMITIGKTLTLSHFDETPVDPDDETARTPITKIGH